MFADLVGSTALSNELDAEDLRELIGRFQGAASSVIERFEDSSRGTWATGSSPTSATRRRTRTTRSARRARARAQSTQ
jgi:class 3 adenylate cyclase